MTGTLYATPPLNPTPGFYAVTSYFEEVGILAYERVNFVIEVVKLKDDAEPHVTLTMQTWLKYLHVLNSMRRRAVWVDGKEIKENVNEFVKLSSKKRNILTTSYVEYVDMNFTHCNKIKYVIGISFKNKAINYGYRKNGPWHVIYLFLLSDKFRGNSYASDSVSVEILSNPLVETGKIIIYVVLAFVILSYIRNKYEKAVGEKSGAGS